MALRDQLASYAGAEGEGLLLSDGSVNPQAKGRIPTQEEMQYEYVAPGDDALLPWGIIFTADWKAPASGMGKHSRQQVTALAMAGLPIRLESLISRSVFTDDLHPEVRSVAYLENVTLTQTLFAIKHLVIHDADQLRRAICSSAATVSQEHLNQVYASTIIYTSWERSTVDPEIVGVLNRVGQVWVPCSTNARVFMDSGVNNVFVIPYPFDPNTCDIAAPRGKEDVPEGRRYYNIGKWEPRKNQHRIIGAFLLAHTPADRASLLLKTSKFSGRWAGYPTPEESVQCWLSDADVAANGWTQEALDRRVRIINEEVSDAEVHKLHKMNNIYVSASCGEAWDIPAFEAKCAGNRLVHVGYGGSEDYADPLDVDVPYRMVPVHPGYQWEADAEWAQCTVEELAACMKSVVVPVRRIMPSHIVTKFSNYAVAKMMRDAILELAHRHNCSDLLIRSGGFG
jgi:glycosyltransferase involved in cell wall biosynthesis